MKKLPTILIVVCLWCQNAQSDDIRDLEIEGLSIGYSLLNLFNKDEIHSAIDEHRTFVYPDGKYKIIRTHTTLDSEIAKPIKEGLYDYVGTVIKTGDRKFTIYGIQARMYITDETGTCPEEKGKIVNELKSDFPDAKIQEKKGPHSYDKTGKSIADYTWFVMSDGNVSVSCTIWAGKLKERFKNNTLKVSINSKKYADYLNTAYQ